MYYIEVHNKINQIVELFQRFGMWQIENESTGYRKIGLKLLYLIFIVSFVMSVVSGGLVSDDWNEAVFLIVMGIAVFIATVKLIYVLWKKEEIRAFIQDIGAHSVEDNEAFTKLNGKVKNLMKFSSSLFLSICVTCGVMFTFCLPIFSNGKHLPLNIWFPLDWKNNTFFYWIAYAYVLIGTIISVLASALNFIIWYLMMNCAIKYETLGNHFTNIFLTKSTINMCKISNGENESLFLQNLIRLIKTHQNIQKTIDRFKSCFGNMFFTQISTSGICICGSVYALAFGAHDENLTQRMFHSTVLCYNFFDIFMVMYLGNEIKLLSDRLSYCLFESNWSEQSKSCQKCIIIMSEKLKQPHKLLIGKLYTLDMETFTSIVKLAYSMFNVLKNLN